jgi:dihydroorotate dehydrogenase (fumarate)/dihydroorotate dehydrogenase
MGAGGIAGKATTEDALRILDDVATRARGRLAVKSSGGVFSGEDAYRRLEAGASAIELYSAFIYRGWGVARAIARELVDELDRHDVPSVAAIPRPATAAAA